MRDWMEQTLDRKHSMTKEPRGFPPAMQTGSSESLKEVAARRSTSAKAISSPRNNSSPPRRSFHSRIASPSRTRSDDKTRIQENLLARKGMLSSCHGFLKKEKRG